MVECLIVVISVMLACVGLAAATGDGPVPAPGPHDPQAAGRDAMVRDQIAARGVRDARVLDAMRRVPRHRFVPPVVRSAAHADRPLPIGHSQTISQPYIVALMTELAQVAPGDRVLEVGTGSGYQAAVLAEMGASVYSIEIVPELGREAAALLSALGYEDVHVRVGDGFDGWPERAPFAAILLTASPAEIPRPLLDQLAVGGRLVAPVGVASQELVVVTRTVDGWQRRAVLPVRFVPMTGKAQEGD